MRAHASAVLALSLAALSLQVPSGCASPGSSRSDGTLDPSGERTPSVSTLYSMSKILVSRSKDAEAETVLSKLIAEHPDFRPAYADLAELYMRHARPECAAEVLRAGVKVAPEDAVLHNNLGMCLLVQGRNEEALESFTTAAASLPKDARSRANMAVALGMLGRLDESLSLYMQLMSPADAHFNLGVLCEARKDTDRAAQEFEIADSLRSGRKNASAR